MPYTLSEMTARVGTDSVRIADNINVKFAQVNDLARCMTVGDFHNIKVIRDVRPSLFQSNQ